ASASLKSPHNSTINYSSFFGKAQALASSLFAQILPQAHAAEESDEAKNTMLEKLRAKFRRGGESGLKQNLPPSVPVEPTTNGNSNGTNKSNLKQWAVVGALYGGTGLAAFGMAHDIDWRGLITSDMTDRVKIVAGMMGAVFVGSVVLKYTLYRETFKKQYPYEKESSLLTKINAEHKGILDIFTHSLWFSMSIIPQGIRHVLHYLKTRFIPDNKIIEKMWDATMGYQMRQNAHLAMNYKTFYLGAIVLGMSDSLLVAVDLLIIFPWLLQNFGIEVAAGGATAAFVSAEILRNFLSYLQSGAHNYSSEVKMINLMAVEKEVRRQMTAEGINVNLPRNRPEINRRVDLLMEKRFKNYGLPGSDQFRFDPISFIEHWSEYLGFRIPPNHEFKNGEHPARLALKRVLALAEEAQSRSPSDLGAQTVTALEKASDDKHDLKQGDWGLTSQVLKNALLLAEQDQKASPSEIGAHTVATLKKAVQDQFVFRRSHWGLARPVVKRALALAEEAQKIAPSAVGEQTVAALKRATHSLSMIKAGAYGLVKTVTNKQDWADFASTIRDEMEEAKNQGHNTSYDHLKAVLKGTLKALVANSTKDVRAIRNVLFLATVSTEIEGYREYMPKSWVEMAG
ncbi:MAG: hypothetical protein KDD35_08890, partial [Bdellovibrionales bacterium]|nr:hypothetical protein [Bdellovibrionales bacterium]